MQLFVKMIDGNAIVHAKHADEQVVPAGAYPGTRLVSVPNATALPRVGVLDTRAHGDFRPEGLPDMTGDLLAYAIKAECRRRILARLSAVAQQNMAHHAVALMTAPQAMPFEIAAALKTYQEIRAWIGRPDGMQGRAEALAAAGDRDYWQDEKWPAWSAAWDSYVAHF